MRCLLATLLLLAPYALAQQDLCQDNDYFYGELLVASPDTLAGTYHAAIPEGGTWGDTTGLLSPGTTGEVVIARSPGGTDFPDHGTVSGPDELCEAPSNAAELVGKIALIKRGSCTFSLKALYAQQAGAVGFLIDNVTSVIQECLVKGTNVMLGGVFGPDVTIPGLLVEGASGCPDPIGGKIRIALEAGEVTVVATLGYHDCYEGPIPDNVEENVIPGVRELSTAHPNPFIARTEFALALDKAQHVSVRAYDVLGREVVRLHDGTLTAGGDHTFTFEASTLPAGVYLVRVTGETFAQTRRVVLTR